MFCRRCYRNMQNWDITAEEFRIKIMQGAVIIDVRSRQEYREGHLEGAINIPEFEARNRITKEILNKKSVFLKDGFFGICVFWENQILNNKSP